jgi:hypothetical protein
MIFFFQGARKPARKKICKDGRIRKKILSPIGAEKGIWNEESKGENNASKMFLS